MKNTFFILLFLYIGFSVEAQIGVGVNTNSPMSNFEDYGSFALKSTTISANVTLDSTYNQIICANATSITVTLPAANTCSSRIYHIKRNASSTASVIVAGVIDGTSNITLSNQNTSITIFSDGTNWLSRDGDYKDGWAVVGSSGTSAATNFVGTTDAVGLAVKTNNTEAVTFLSTFAIGINNTSPTVRLQVRQNVSGSKSTPLIIQNGVSGNPANTQVIYNVSPSSSATIRSGTIGAINRGGNVIDMPFSTTNGTTAIAEQMRLISEGNLGINTTTPTSNIQVLGSIALATTATTTSLTLNDTHFSVINNNTTTPTNLTLPAATSCLGRMYQIKKNNTSTANVTIVGTVDGVVNPTLIGKNSNAIIFSDGTNWLSSVGSQSLNYSAWSIYGNSSLSAANNFIGTTDINPFVIKTNNTERVRILSTGLLGVSTSVPLSTVELNGSFAANVITTSADISLDATHHIVIITGGTPTITLPPANTCSNRIYHVTNTTGSARTISSYTNLSNATATTIAANAAISIISDGSTWKRFQ